MTKICIYGAGAIGGYMAAALTEAGADVSLIARGPHLAAIKQNGLTLLKNGEAKTYQLTASDNSADLGPQDFVIISLKANAISKIAGVMQPLLGPETAVVSAVNGLPWWPSFNKEIFVVTSGQNAKSFSCKFNFIKISLLSIL